MAGPTKTFQEWVEFRDHESTPAERTLLSLVLRDWAFDAMATADQAYVMGAQVALEHMLGEGGKEMDTL